MSSLATNDKQILETLFQMGGGYVVNFSDRTFAEFFRDDIGVDIDDARYLYASNSKANRLRRFWQISDDALAAKSISKLLAYIDTQIAIGRLRREQFSEDLASRAKGIAARLAGTKSAEDSAATEDEFIARDFAGVSVDKLSLDPVVSGILKQRLEEIKRGLSAKTPLAVIFLCGSTLEGILLGVASMKPREFNQSPLSPKHRDTGKVKHFPDWTLNEFINVARDLNLLGEDVKKFSHALRDFRNYIHPYEQMSSGFNPDEHTAKICWQVLQAAIYQLSS